MPSSTIKLVLVIVVTAVAIVGGAFFYKTYLQKPNPTKSPITLTPQKVSSLTNNNAASSAILPVPLDNKKVNSASVKYNFGAAKLSDIKNTTKDLILTTTLKSNGVNATIVVTKDTKVVFINTKTNVETPATSADLKKEQIIKIQAEYNLKKKTWTTSKVSIHQ